MKQAPFGDKTKVLLCSKHWLGNDEASYADRYCIYAKCVIHSNKQKPKQWKTKLDTQPCKTHRKHGPGRSSRACAVRIALPPGNRRRVGVSGVPGSQEAKPLLITEIAVSQSALFPRENDVFH